MLSEVGTDAGLDRPIQERGLWLRRCGRVRIQSA